MYYISPFTLLGTGERVPPAGELPALIRAARKRHLVEAQLHPDGLVEAGGHRISKHDALNLLEELKDPFSCKLHVAVFEQRKFCNFLENGTPGHINWEIIKQSPGGGLFVPFVRPYFIQRLLDEHVNALRGHNAARMWALREIRIPRRDEVLDKFYDRLLDIVYSDLEEFRNNISNCRDAVSMQAAMRFTENEAINTWNALPSEMEGVRDDLAEHFVKLYGALQSQKQEHEKLHHVAEQAARLSCGNTGKLWQSRLARMHDEQFTKFRYANKTSGKEQNTGATDDVHILPGLTAEKLITILSVVGLTCLVIVLLQ